MATEAQDNKEPTQYNVRLTAFEIGAIQGLIKFVSKGRACDKEIDEIYDKLENAFQSQVTCQVNTLLGNEEAL